MLVACFSFCSNKSRPICGNQLEECKIISSFFQKVEQSDGGTHNSLIKKFGSCITTYRMQAPVLIFLKPVQSVNNTDIVVEVISPSSSSTIHLCSPQAFFLRHSVSGWDIRQIALLVADLFGSLLCSSYMQYLTLYSSWRLESITPAKKEFSFSWFREQGVQLIQCCSSWIFTTTSLIDCYF